MGNVFVALVLFGSCQPAASGSNEEFKIPTHDLHDAYMNLGACIHIYVHIQLG